MRILLLTDDYYPSTRAGARMMHDLGAQLRHEGNEIMVACPSDAIVQAAECSEEDGMTIVRIKNGSLKNTHRAVRAWRELRLSSTFWRNGCKMFRSRPCDLIIYYSPSIFFGALVQRLKKLWHCPAYLILRDIFPKWAVDAGVIRNRWIHRYLRRVELAQYAAADVIGVEAPGNLRYFEQELSGKNYRLEVLVNWGCAEATGRCTENLRGQLGLNGKVVFFYGGNIGVAQDVDNIVRLAASVQDHKQIYFLIVGSGSESERLQLTIAEQSLQNIAILPPVPQDRYLDFVNEFDVGLVSLNRQLKTHNFPGKLLGYMSCAKPILASINSGNHLLELLESSQAGIGCVNGDDQAFRAGALRLASQAELRKRMGQNARTLLEGRFSVVAASRQILAHFVDLPCRQEASSLLQSSREALA